MLKTLTTTGPILLVALTPLLAQSEDAQKQSPNDTSIRKVRTTAYTHEEIDHRKWAKNTASGTTLKATVPYNSAAADWSVFPVHTKFRIQGQPGIYVIDDYGRALVGTTTIDIYHSSITAMKTWGVRHVLIEILEFGDYEESLRLLEGRRHHPHCLAMYESIQEKTVPPSFAPDIKLASPVR